MLAKATVRGSQVSREENKAVIRRLFDEVYNDQNLDVLDELVAEDVVNHAAAAEHKHGIEGFRHVIEWTYALAPDARSELIDMIAEGEKVACRVRVSGTQEGEIFGIPPTGKSFTAEYAYWHCVVGGGLGGEGRPWYPDPVGHHLPAGKVDGREPSLEGSCIPGT
jgi:predicted ester cyclase